MKSKIIVDLSRLESLQQHHRITDAQLADLGGLNITQVWRVKNKRSNPGHDFIACVLRVFPEIKFEDVFKLENPIDMENSINKNVCAHNQTIVQKLF